MDLLTTSKVALMLGMTSDNVRYHEREGHIFAIKVERSPGEFQRLFVQEDIERFQRQRATQALARATRETVEVAGQAINEAGAEAGEAEQRQERPG